MNITSDKDRFISTIYTYISRIHTSTHTCTLTDAHTMRHVHAICMRGVSHIRGGSMQGELQGGTKNRGDIVRYPVGKE